MFENADAILLIFPPTEPLHLMTAESWLQEMWERVRFSALEVPDDVNVIDLAGCAFLWVALIFLGFSYVAMPIMRSQVSPVIRVL